MNPGGGTKPWKCNVMKNNANKATAGRLQQPLQASGVPSNEEKEATPGAEVAVWGGQQLCAPVFSFFGELFCK